ncbi:Glu/Leu/Phe/Val dehydrogenase [Glaciecola sp. MH2013]|uniref:Glu/Leu/Phe/Val dehydrogenase n=1 Tax=Glaciecola sp. MH2013 TaxID=2785524 RepID=UPI00189EE7E2|nr:Glu/Leu/Phe/Val dehydrogenase [Glaciecola sp. MH2013]MBF7072432.1 Glu/Leu/Phe/Val dehydrogenase [Glaciecola sp. MH2013]
MSVFDHPEFAGHEQVGFCHDEKSGLKAVIAVHNTNLGPGLGGCRMFSYANSHEALTDVLRLSKGMTYKAAMAGLPQGGGKAVIIGNPRKDKSEDLMLAMGRFVDSFKGKYITAEDSGIAVSDIHIMGQKTTYVGGTFSKYSFDGSAADGNPAPATAYGVFVGIKAAVKHRFGTDLQGKKIAIKGIGHVGIRLAEHLYRAGAKLYVADIYPEGVNKAVSEFGAVSVDTSEIDALDVDVFAPCALGKSVNLSNINLIKAKVIAGAANNQLENDELDQQLVERGILYAPDYVINAGGVIDIYHQGIDSNATALKAHIEKIGDTLAEIFNIAENENKPTALIANEMAEKRFLKK